MPAPRSSVQELRSEKPRVSVGPSLMGMSADTRGAKANKKPEPPETRRKDFPVFLEAIGFNNALADTVFELYQEPDNSQDPIEYFLNRLTSNMDMRYELDVVQDQILGLEEELADLMNKNELLHDKLNSHERAEIAALENAGKVEESDEGKKVEYGADGKEEEEQVSCWTQATGVENVVILTGEDLMSEIQREISNILTKSQTDLNADTIAISDH